MVAQNEKTEKGPAAEQCLTARDVAKLFKVTDRTIWRWVENVASFPKPRQYGGAVRWLESEITQYMRGFGR